MLILVYKIEKRKGKETMLKKFFGDKKHIADVILIASLLVIAISVFLFVFLSRVEGSTATVYIKDKKVAEYSLAVDGVYYLNDGKNILVIEDGSAYLSFSECPDKTCVYGNTVFGNKISYVGEDIICLPNMLRVVIEGEGEGIL